MATAAAIISDNSECKDDSDNWEMDREKRNKNQPFTDDHTAILKDKFFKTIETAASV
jgi:hypothetical protein